MPDLTSVLFPNFNLDALMGVLIAIVGIIVLVLGLYVNSLPVIGPLLGKWINAAGALLILGGLIYWVGTSIIQDLLADQQLFVIGLITIGLVVFAFILFTPTKKPAKWKRA